LIIDARNWRDTRDVATGVPAQFSVLKQDVVSGMSASTEATCNSFSPSAPRRR
jgi:hypothetical protein